MNDQRKLWTIFELSTDLVPSNEALCKKQMTLNIPAAAHFLAGVAAKVEKI
jgi:hypothetical protein